MRRFLSLAYSSFQLQVEQTDMSEWKWTNWLWKNRNHLAFIISFNYDLVLEKALKTNSIPFYRVGSNEERNGIPIFKPHGSIDFDLDASQYPPDSRWSTPTFLQDKGYIETLPKKNWLQPRLEADIIPPHKENYQRVLTWVQQGIQAFLQYKNTIDTFVIIGHSYGEADRQEIDQYLEHLSQGTTIHIVDPDPNPLLIEKIESLELHHVIQKDNFLP